jgi:hypothetical protein
MKITPARGQAFVQEDSEDFSAYEKMGLEMPEEAKKGVGTTGVILEITHDQEGLFPYLRHLLFAERVPTRFKVGQRVVFDRFIAQDIYLRDESGQEVPRLRCLPIDCILGSLSQ